MELAVHPGTVGARHFAIHLRAFEPGHQRSIADQELQRRLPHYLPRASRHGDLYRIQQQPAEPGPPPAFDSDRPAHHAERFHQ